MCDCLTWKGEKNDGDSGDDEQPLCVKDFEQYLDARLPKAWSGFISGAADEGSTHGNNQASWQRLRIRPRYLTGISRESIDTSCDFLGWKLKSPICMTAAGLQCLAHEEGEVATAKACETFGSCMVLSIGTTKTYTEVVAACKTALIGANIEVPRKRETLDKFLVTVEESGFKFIVLTVDIPIIGNRIHDKKNKFSLPDTIRAPVVEHIVKESLGPDATPEDVRANMQPSTYSFHLKHDLGWDDVKYIVSKCKLPLLLKGIVTAEDAALAVEHGVKGLVVSNHGGRQLDCVPSTMEALPEVVAAVDGRIPVFVDGGIRLGTDVFKALAVGATAVFIGRPIFWGLAYKGQEGVERVFGIMQEELERTMTLAGCKNLTAITRKHVIHEMALWSGL